MPPTPASLATAPQAALSAGKYRDRHYLSWWLFSPSGAPSLSYPINIQPYRYGHFVVPPEQLQAINSDTTGQPFLSPVYYDPTLHKAFLDIYSLIYRDGEPTKPFLGFLRASLNLDAIWNMVHNDQGFNHSGGAFILDQHGIRIADTKETDPQKLFRATVPLAAPLQHQISAENWYGQGSNATLLVKSPLSTPKGDEVASQKLTIQNWTYTVTSPGAAITQVADDQLKSTILVAIVMAMLAAAIVFWVSSRITRPIMRSVGQLRENSKALTTLAKKQQSVSSEQVWVLEAIHVCQQSLQYYTDATGIAAQKLSEVGVEFESNEHEQNMEIVKQGMQRITTVANYIGKATHYQSDSSQKLAVAIKVTTQVNEQLAEGALSATKTASQLETVVNDLRSVIGQ